MELLATVDWLITQEGCDATVEALKKGIANWPAGSKAALRKAQLFDDKSIGFALEKLASVNL